jgi:hypothetical protein
MKGQHAFKAPGLRGNRGAGELRLIWIDQNPLRTAAADDCREVRGQLDAMRTAWNRFEREDKPGFARWRAREFGPLLSELRETEAKIREIETLVHEVEREMSRGFFAPQTAYERVKARRADPFATEPEPEPEFQPRGGGDRKVSDFEKEALFQEWVQKYIGTNPDKLDDEAYSTTFEAFKAHMFRSRPVEPLPRFNSRPPVNEPAMPSEPEPDAEPVDIRVKQLYRLLVRRLHPDLRADGSAAASALWHEVQDAYAATDIAQLEILLALSDIQANPFRDDMSVSQMRAVVDELNRALFALEDSLRQARNDDAWDFARAGAGDDLRTSVERDLRADLRIRRDRLALLRQTIETWSRPPRLERSAYGRPGIAAFGR